MSAEIWNVDRTHTSAEFEVQHMHVSTYRAQFTRVDGKVTFEGEDPTSIEATVDATSIAVDDKTLYGVLQGEEFFASEQHPNLIFKSSRIEKIDPTHWRAEGTLAIRGVERPFTLDIEAIGAANQPFYKRPMRAFRATGSLDRSEYGIKWQAFLDNGAAYLGEKVRVSLNVELLKAD